MSGPHISIPVIQVLYGVLHAIEGNNKLSFMVSLLRQAIDGVQFIIDQNTNQQEEIYKLESNVSKLKKLVSTPSGDWSELDRNWVKRITTQ
jgi:hypothetical protein